MNWHQLGYLCRLYSATNNLSATQQSQLSEVSHLQIYGHAQRHSALAKKLADELINSSNQQQQTVLADCYSRLPKALAKSHFEYKKQLLYITAVFATFIAISFIYQLYVIPTFTEILSSHQLYFDNPFSWYNEYWYGFLLLLAILFVILCLTIFKLRDACYLSLSEPFCGVLGLLIPPKIKQEYAILMAILSFPAKLSQDNCTLPELIHLESCRLHGLNVNEEFGCLVKQKVLLLHSLTQKYISALIMLFTVVMVVAIYLFLKEAYQPIFMIGEIV
ncbi:hypothetical protein NDQ71_12400 [Pseudoalteromonas sp. KG3]|uniref:Uncharacterized protein n=1 Tax=Pseudoalteromonas prydzensis TaxID=182141 RepID=A0ABR9FMW0_9GAMM|nr:MULTISPECIES: hypothetical protein [Pseudoalteromonas]MBE0458145.1 hypothetical protein [Pseudoalteromonas prydzensis]WKD22460.1 hypothetical protein NDQ71_12400 [Pseudoalteromonas sp. KG3]